MPSAILDVAPGPGWNENSSGRSTASSSADATSPRPEWRATSGRAPAAAPSMATIPKASSRMEGTRRTSIAASALGA